MREFTPRDEEVLMFIHNHQQAKGYSPTVREISRNLYMSTTSVQRHLYKLVELGYLRMTPKTPRSIVLNIAV